MRKLNILFIMFFIFILLAGCSSAELKTYVAADKATYEAVSGEYLKYIEADNDLDGNQKDRRRRLIKTWKMRIDNAEGDK